MKKPYVKDPNAPGSVERFESGSGQVFANVADKDLAPWTKNWDVNNLADMPHNPTTGKPYTKGNATVLNARHAQLVDEGKIQDVPDNRWMTLVQGNGVGAKLRAGEKGTMLITKFSVPAKPGEKSEQKDVPASTEDKAKSDKPRWGASHFFVFHASQFDNMPARTPRPERPLDERVQAALDLVEKSGAQVEHGGNRPHYSPSRDVIRMPERSSFKNDGEYASTLLHELGHWSGAAGRLDRKMGGSFGSREYATEELRAEIFSYNACQALQLPFVTGESHQAYVKHWAEIGKADPKEILQAARDADKICEYLGVPTPQFEVLPQVEKDKAKHAPLKGPGLKPELSAPQPRQPGQVQDRGR